MSNIKNQTLIVISNQSSLHDATCGGFEATVYRCKLSMRNAEQKVISHPKHKFPIGEKGTAATQRKLNPIRFLVIQDKKPTRVLSNSARIPHNHPCGELQGMGGEGEKGRRGGGGAVARKFCNKPREPA